MNPVTKGAIMLDSEKTHESNKNNSSNELTTDSLGKTEEGKSLLKDMKATRNFLCAVNAAYAQSKKSTMCFVDRPSSHLEKIGGFYDY